MRAKEREGIVVTLSDKRLLSMDEFCIYAGLGTSIARNVAETTGALFRVGRRVLVDRVSSVRLHGGIFVTLFGCDITA